MEKNKRKKEDIEKQIKDEICKITSPIFDKVLKEAQKEGKLKKITASPDFKFSVINAIKLGMSPAELSKKWGLKLGHLDYYLKPFKIVGILIKKGYGTWAINEEKYQEFLNTKELKNSSAVVKKLLPKSLTSKPIRGHGFQFTLKIPKLENWDKREEFLKKNDISFNPIGSNWKGQRIMVRGHKVWLTPISIVIYAPKAESWFAAAAEHSKNHAVYDFLQLVNSTENLLKVSFEIKKKYWFKVTRQHYALVKNALAIQYDKEEKKLYISNPRGMWFVIDNSYNLHESETLSPATADKDMDNVAKPLFDDLDKLQVNHKDFFGEPANAAEILNDAKDHFDSTGETLTLSKILAIANKAIEIGSINTQNQKLYAENMVSHVEAVRKLGIAVEKLTETVSSKQSIARKPQSISKTRKYGLSDEDIKKIKNVEF